MSRVDLSRVELSELLGRALLQPAAEGARVVALHWLHALRTARAAMREAVQCDSTDASSESKRRAPADPAGLHKARVALRRLRATLRTHRDLIDIGRRLPRTLRTLHRATNTARDADVQRAWLAAEYETLDQPAREEGARLLHKLSGDVAREARRVEKAFARYFDPVEDTLLTRLAHYSERRVVGRESSHAMLAAVLGAHVDAGIADIQRGLQAAIADVDPLSEGTAASLHALRIVLKRQRAMLAPFASDYAAVAAWYACATRGQDALGAMRDASVLAATAKKHELPALEAALRATALGHFAAFHRAWCGDADAVQRVTHAALAAANELAAVAAAGTLPREIERKYLLREVPPQVRTVLPTLIEQGWLPGDRLHERLRRATRADGMIRLTRTVKIGRLGSRIELEDDTEPALFDAMWPHTRSARIRKHRHAIREESLVWEIDIFLDRALVLAEVELTEGNEIPQAPAWLAPYIVRDVTDEPAYTNASMAAPDADDVMAGGHKLAPAPLNAML